MDKYKLTEDAAANLGNGMHSDGDYLWLRVRGNARSWIVRGPRDGQGKRQELGLGSVRRVSLKWAREKRDTLLNRLASGIDPKTPTDPKPHTLEWLARDLASLRGEVGALRAEIDKLKKGKSK